MFGYFMYLLDFAIGARSMKVDLLHPVLVKLREPILNVYGEEATLINIKRA